MQSTSGTPQGDSMSEGRTRFACILPTSVRLPLGSPIDQTGFIEVNLADIPTETLQLVQVQIHEEFHEREYSTYQRNGQLIKANDQLQAQHDAIKVELMKQQYEESQFKKTIEDICE